MDLSQFDTKEASERGTFLHLEVRGQKLMTEDGKRIGIRVLGRHSKKVREVDHQQQNARLKNLSVRGGRVRGLTADQIEDNATNILVAACVEFENIELDGEKLACTPDNVRKLFERLPWVREQVDERLNDEEALLGES